jgi:hypothetical protein
MSVLSPEFGRMQVEFLLGEGFPRSARNDKPEDYFLFGGKYFFSTDPTTT